VTPNLPKRLALFCLFSAPLSQALGAPQGPQATAVSTKSRLTSAPALSERGFITRRALEAVLKRGPQVVMASVRVLPVRIKGRFAGFELSMIAPGSPAERAGFKVGDALISINGRSLERPEVVMELWSSLAQASELTISFRRAGERLSYRWQLSPK